MTGAYKDLVDRLEEERCLSATDGYRRLLAPDASPEDIAYLHDAARRVARAVFGGKIYARALIEITNRCRNNCLYCGLRRDNSSLSRYSLDTSTIVECCGKAYEAGFRTFVLQGGEDPAATVESICSMVAQVHGLFPDAAITLSLGEWPDAAYAAFYEAGATRYLLRHETRNPYHYSRLHPPGMSLDNRLRCLETLKQLGYQTGTGIMVGSPFQTYCEIAEDLEYMAALHPEMIGIGPFIPHSATPFSGFPSGSVDMTLRLISILRLMFPNANIPSTTALATVGKEGRVKGILAGANVVMPNASPPEVRECYSLYNGKMCRGREALEGLEALKRELAAAGYELSFEKGDFNYQYV